MNNGGSILDTRNSWGHRIGVSVPAPPLMPNSAPYRTSPRTPPDDRGEFRSDADRRRDHGMYSGDDY